MLTRRSALLGLTAIAAPAVIRTPGLLMPVKPLPSIIDSRLDVRRLWQSLQSICPRFIKSETLGLPVDDPQILKGLDKERTGYVVRASKMARMYGRDAANWDDIVITLMSEHTIRQCEITHAIA